MRKIVLTVLALSLAIVSIGCRVEGEVGDTATYIPSPR
jgi:hypothetical protein